jgi:DNA-binding MurR/RpiR family transcriptional regulator
LRKILGRKKMTKKKKNVEWETSNCLFRIKTLLSQLKGVEKQIAEYVLENSHEVVGIPITELAKKTKSSESTVVRFCRKLGYTGYQEFKVKLASSLITLQELPSSDLSFQDDLTNIKRKIVQANINAIKETDEILSESEIKKAVNAINKARKVDLYGVGASGLVALDLQQKLERIGILAYAYIDTHQQLVSASLLNPQDVAIGISYSGSTKDTISALAKAKENNATTIAITQYAHSPILKHTDIKLFLSAKEIALRVGAITSLIAQLTVVDVLYVSILVSRGEKIIEVLARSQSATTERKL